MQLLLSCYCPFFAGLDLEIVQQILSFIAMQTILQYHTVFISMYVEKPVDFVSAYILFCCHNLTAVIRVYTFVAF